MKNIVFSAVAGVAPSVLVTACATMDDGAGVTGANTFTEADSLCRVGEEALFQCRAGAKTIALCGGGAEADRYIQYRYGRPGAVELAYPARGTAGLTRANIPFSGGGETQVNFTNGGASYSIYSRTTRTSFDARGNNPEFSAGVVVRQRGVSDVEIGCTAPSDETFGAAVYDLLPEGPAVMGD